MNALYLFWLHRDAIWRQDEPKEGYPLGAEFALGKLRKEAVLAEALDDLLDVLNVLNVLLLVLRVHQDIVHGRYTIDIEYVGQGSIDVRLEGRRRVREPERDHGICEMAISGPKGSLKL